jgi:hypothetical protein
MTEFEHDPVESGRPSLGRRDQPDAIRPDADDRPDRKLPADEDAADVDAPDAPSGPGAER